MASLVFVLGCVVVSVSGLCSERETAPAVIEYATKIQCSAAKGVPMPCPGYNSKGKKGDLVENATHVLHVLSPAPRVTLVGEQLGRTVARVSRAFRTTV